MTTETKSIRLTEQEVSKVLCGLDNADPFVDLKDKIGDQLRDQAPEPERGPLMEGREHFTAEGLFRSDKYPWSQDGFVPLKVTDEMAWPMLRAYAAAREGKDLEFTRDLDEALDKVGAPSMSHFLAQGEDSGGSMIARAQEITDEVVGKMIDKEMMRLHPSSPWDRETVIMFIHHAALRGLVESRDIVEGLQSPSAIADMMAALAGTLEQMEDGRGLPQAHEGHIRRREFEDEVLRLSRKVE